MCWINVSFFASDERPDARGITDSVGGPPRTLLTFVRLPFDILFWSWRGISLTQSSGKLCDVKCLEHYFVQMHVLFCIFERSLIHWNGVIYIKMLRPLSAEFLWVIIVFSRCISLHITHPCTNILKHFVCISVPRIRHKLTWKYFMWAYVHPHPPPGHDQFLFYGRSLPQALCRASLCSLKVLACVEVSLSLPSVPLNGSAPTLTLQHFKGRPKGGWTNMDMCRRPCNKGGGWEGRGYQWLMCSQQEKVHCHSLPEVQSPQTNQVFLASSFFSCFWRYVPQHWATCHVF